LMEDDTIRMAVEICEEGAFTREEMEAYEAYWDHITLEVEIAEESEENKKQLKYKDKIIEDNKKALEANKKALEDKDRFIEELKKQLSARSL
ncbi:MAG: hypothetical protein LBL04_06210, partial [Bacteroidales bacterium]|nr:hypothetical protein [Bacteroidales bacterium]